MTSILDHPDYESCIKPWAAAVAAGKKPPRVESKPFGMKEWNALLDPPRWLDTSNYRLSPRRIKIGDREVNAPVDRPSTEVLILATTCDCKRIEYPFSSSTDAIAARDAIIELLSK